MPRSADSQLLELNEGCITRSTVDIRLRSGVSHFFSTEEELNLDADYTPRLLHIGGLQETATKETNRVPVTLSNVDLTWGLKLASDARELELADVVIRRLYRDAGNSAINQHKHFFTGKIVNAGADEKEITFDVIRKSTAMGTSFAYRTLSPICPWIYKDRNCKDAGDFLDCNQLLKSRHGCRGRDNFEHNGSFAYPETPTQAAPGSGGNGGEGVGGGTCFLKGTSIFTPRGEQPIEALRRFFRVYSFNPMTREIEVDSVEDVFEYTVSGYFELIFGDGSNVSVTPEHPFLTESNEYVRADDLKIPSGGNRGSIVWRFIKGVWKRVELKRFKWHLENVQVHNLHVLRNRNYFANRYAVHNKAPLEIVV